MENTMGTGGGLVVIDFSEHGNSAHFRGEGWSGQEKDRVWGIGPRSVLRIPIQSSGRSIILEAEIGPCHAPPAVTGQIVHVRVNGVALGGVRLESPAMVRCEMAPAIARPDGVLEVEFECPGYYMPGWLGISGDKRPLSCWFNFIRLYTTDMFSPGPHFPASSPDIPVIGLSPPFAGPPWANSKELPAVYTFGRTMPAPGDFRRDFRWDVSDVGEDDFVVSEGSSGQLKLLAPRTSGCYVLRIDAFPVFVTEQPHVQDVTILLDGIVIGQFSLREPTAWIVPLPVELTERRDILRLTFMLPDHGRHTDFGDSSDTRATGIAVTRVSILPLPSYLTPAENLRAEVPRPIAASGRFLMDASGDLPALVSAALGLDLISMLRGFESLGTDSEFAVVQRKLGLEVLNLFRFGNKTLADLVWLLTGDLTALTDPDRFTVEPAVTDPAENSLTLPASDFLWRNVVREDDDDQDPSCRASAVTLGYLRRKFYEGLRAGRKIYVLKRQRFIPTSEAAVLLTELNRSGHATLLCVEEAPSGRLPGEVELLTPGLMRGYVGRSAQSGDLEPGDLGSVALSDWLRMLANAMLLRRGSHGIGAT
jgi:hypothetical protein